MNIDLVIQENEKVLLQENMAFIKKTIDKITKTPWKKAKTFLQNSFRTLVKLTKEYGIEDEVLSIINKMVKGQYKKMTDISNTKIKESVNEGFGDFWDEAKGSFYGATSFYPLLQAFIELDKVVKGTDPGADLGYVGVYGLMWAAIVGAKTISGKINKKQNDIGKAYMEM